MVKNKEAFLILLAVFLAAVVFALVIIIAFFPSKNPSAPTTVPGASKADNLIPSSPQDIIKMNNQYMVGQLIKLTPYNGKNFSLYYSFNDSLFTLYLNPANQNEGNKEFDLFLKKNGIDDRSWFDNLQTTTQKVTPQP